MKPLAAKSMVTVFLLLALLIPISMVSSLVDERKSRLGQVYRDMERSWGGENTALGGVFISAGTETIVPERSIITGTVKAEVRERGIFKIPFYTAELVIRGNFNASMRDNRRINLSIFDNGAEIKNVKINGRDVPFYSYRNENIPNALVIAKYTGGGDSKDGGRNEVAVTVNIKGINKLLFQQISGKTEISLKSNWKDPGFTGSVMPSSRSIDENGFQARWELSGLINSTGNSPQIFSEEDSFGVSLFIPVNVYTLTDRSIKYAILFIGLTFLAFFLFEIFGRLKIHPFQYLLVGFALTIFYLLLLSLSEFMSFGLSYFIASLATIGLIVMYSAKILMARSRTFIMGGMLVILYAFLYILLQMEQYSLLLGSAALFFVLASVMYLTRNVNWYEIQEG